METPDDAKSSELAGIVHDINNLLGVMLNFATLAKEKLNAVAADPSKLDHLQLAIKDLDRIHHAGEGAVKLSRQLTALVYPEEHTPRP